MRRIRFGRRVGGGKKEDVPWYSYLKGVLYSDEVSEYTQSSRSCSHHNEHPEVELRFGPVVSPPSHPDFSCHFMGGGWKPSGRKGRRRSSRSAFAGTVSKALLNGF